MTYLNFQLEKSTFECFYVHLNAISTHFKNELNNKFARMNRIDQAIFESEQEIANGAEAVILILIEAQATWTVNILFRILMYLVQTYREYFRITEQDIYNSTKLKMPKPELYIIYTGNRKERPEEISFSEEFFGGDIINKNIIDGDIFYVIFGSLFIIRVKCLI